MKRRRVILVVCAALLLASAFAIWHIGTRAEPKLLFVEYTQTPPLTDYAQSPSNGSWYALLVLTNTTRDDIWYIKTGEAGENSRLPYFEKPRINPVIESSPSVYSLRVGSFFMMGVKLMPGEALPFEVPLVSGDPPKQIGFS